jgi:hypothetical protein
MLKKTNSCHVQAAVVMSLGDKARDWWSAASQSE